MNSFAPSGVCQLFESPKNIYQIGIDKCRNGSCTGNAPEQQPYYFWAYGRMTSTQCGAAVAPTAVYIANAATSAKTYKVIREPIGSGQFYVAYVGSTAYQWRLASDLENCWNGVDEAQYLNEVFDGQSGGTTADHQNWSEVFWNNGSSWFSVIGSPGANCITTRSTHTWDTRF